MLLPPIGAAQCKQARVRCKIIDQVRKIGHGRQANMYATAEAEWLSVLYKEKVVAAESESSYAATTKHRSRDTNCCDSVRD